MGTRGRAGCGDATLKQRLFVAVPVPAPVRDSLDEALRPARTAAPNLRWIPPHRWHVTLLFLGGVDEACLGPLTDALATVAERAAPFRMALDGTLGTFPSGVLWAGLHTDDDVVQLAADLRARLGDVVALAGPPRRFQAHLTVARAGRDRRSLVGLARSYAGPAAGWPVDSIELMRSYGGREPRYEMRARVPLGAGNAAT